MSAVNPFSHFETWRSFVSNSIFGASIARQAHDMVASGRGVPTKDDMIRFVEEASAIAELWEETTK